jgi:hypothetical protein
MSNLDVVENILEHFGVKGMKWGVRSQRIGDTAVGGLGISTTGSRARASARKVKNKEVRVSDKPKKLKTSGGKGLPTSSDAIRARTLGQIGKESGLKALSNDQLQIYSQRLQLEQNVKRLNYNELSPGRRFVATILGRSGNSLASEAVNTSAKKVGKRAVSYAMA